MKNPSWVRAAPPALAELASRVSRTMAALPVGVNLFVNLIVGGSDRPGPPGRTQRGDRVPARGMFGRAGAHDKGRPSCPPRPGSRPGQVIRPAPPSCELAGRPATPAPGLAQLNVAEIRSPYEGPDHDSPPMVIGELSPSRQLNQENPPFSPSPQVSLTHHSLPSVTSSARPCSVVPASSLVPVSEPDPTEAET